MPWIAPRSLQQEGVSTRRKRESEEEREERERATIS